MYKGYSVMKAFWYDSILLCRLLQHRFYKNYYNISLTGGKLLLTRRQL